MNNKNMFEEIKAELLANSDIRFNGDATISVWKVIEILNRYSEEIKNNE